MRYVRFYILLLGPVLLSGQSLDSTAFDFWTGHWKLLWVNSSGDTVYGANRVEKILDGTVIQENFTDPSTGFAGKSWSCFSRKDGAWKQVWVDNRSGYLEFTGEHYGDTLAFVMEPRTVNGKSLVRRMIFYNIREHSFTWDWQSAEEGTGQWELLWRIYYRRE